MPVQINIFLLLFGGLQGFILSVFLIRKRIYRTAYIFLVIYILVMILQILLKVMSKIWLMQNMLELYQLSYRLPFLYGPLIYLLTFHLVKPGRKFKWTDLLHFVPFLLATYVMFFNQSERNPGFLALIFYHYRISTGVQLASIVVYHVLAFRNWREYSRSVRNYFSNVQRTQVKWLRQFVILSLFICVTILTAIYFMYIYYPALTNVRFAFVLLTVFIYWISISAMNQPELFTVIHGNGNNEVAPVPKLTVHRPPQKYNNSGLKQEDMDRIVASLAEVMTQHKPFLDADLTIDDLAKIISCSRHHLSQALNNRLQQSFYDFINTHRVEEAKTLLSDPQYDAHKIASLAYDAGFNSLSTFNDVFKKMNGITPSQFRKQSAGQSRKQRV